MVDEQEELYRGDYPNSNRHFTAAGYERLARLILDIASSAPEVNRVAQGQLMEAIAPWVERNKERIASQVLTNPVAAEEMIDNAVLDTLLYNFDLIRSGSISTWHQFGTLFQAGLRKRLQTLEGHLATFGEHSFSQLDRPFSRSEQNRMQYTTDHFKAAKREELAAGVDRMLSTLPRREQEIVRLRNGAADGTAHTLEEVGRVFGITKERVRQIDSRARYKLQHAESHPPALREWLEEHPDIDQDLLAKRERQTDRRIERRIRQLQSRVRSYLENADGQIDYTAVATTARIAEVDAHQVRALAEPGAGGVDALVLALHSEVPGKLESASWALGHTGQGTGVLRRTFAELRSLVQELQERGPENERTR